jgi:hypothetical protein
VSQILQFSDGVHADVNESVYHQRVPGIVSKTALDLIARSPAHYKAWIDGESEEEESEALSFGRAFHCALLEPDKFDASYTVEPDFGDCRFKANKANRDAWRAEHASHEHLSEEAARCIRGMVNSIRRHPLAGKMIREGKSELTLKWRDPESGLTCKSRLDYYVESRAMIVDAKSTLDARWAKFRRQIVDHRYHVQDALYRSAAVELQLPVQFFVFIACEKTPPYGVATYTLDADGIGRGYSAARADIDTLAACMRDNVWPGYPVGIQEIELPPWA